MKTTQELLTEKVKEIQKALKAGAGEFKDDKMGKVYKRSNEMRRQIAVHAQYGKFPFELMRAKAPNETAEELKYREANHESITKPYWDKGLSVLGRIWAEQNYMVNWGAETDAQQYFTKDYPVHGNIFNYYKSQVTETSVADANALLALHIPSLPTKENELGEVVYDDTRQIEPMLKLYSSEQRIDFAIGEYALLLACEKVNVQHGGQTKKEGLVLYYYDTESIWRIYQTGKKTEYTFEVEYYYQHGCEVLPVFLLPAKQISDDSENVLMESYFQAAVPYLNKAVKLDSTNDAIIAKCSYPTRVYYERDCNNPGCDKGMVPGEGDTPVKCGTCNGSGKLTTFSPMRDYKFQLRNGGFSEEDKAEFPGLAYVSPDSSIIESNDKRIEHWLNTAFTFANIDTRNSTSNGEETATKTRKDNDDTITFLLRFSSQMFQLLADGISVCYKVRYRKPPEGITVHPPVEFDLKTSQELSDEVSMLVKNGAPDVAVREVAKEYMRKRFPAQTQLERRTQAMFYSDPFAAKSTLEIATLKGQGLITQPQALLHFNINSWIDEMLDENADYLSKTDKEIKADMLAMATAMATETGFSAEEILKKQAAGGGGAELGKLPLAIQQLALARMRAEESGDTKLSAALGMKMKELLKGIDT